MKSIEKIITKVITRNKKFRTYGVRSDVELRFKFLDVKHSKH